MKTFSIRDLEHISGIKAHTIRAWERRFNIFTPQRTTTNIRYYQLADLKHLLDITLLLNSGYSISDIPGMTKPVIKGHLLQHTTDAMKQQQVVAHMICSMYAMEIEHIETLLTTSVEDWGIDITIRSIVIPFLERSGITSYKETSSEVHFAVTAVRRKIVFGIESINNTQGNLTALLFLPENEHYDLMLLYMNYILRKKGINVLYLGTNISISNLHSVITTKKPAFLCTYIPGHKKEQHNNILQYLVQNNSAARLCVVSNKEKKHSDAILNQFSFLHFKDFEEFEMFL